MGSAAPIRMAVLVLLFGVGPAAQMPGLASRRAASVVPPAEAVVLAAANDPYLPLAEEIVAHDRLPLAHSMAGALAHDPAFLLWVASPAHLSDRAIVDAGRALKGRSSAVAAGIISGATVEEARALWQRAGDVHGERAVAVNAHYPAAGVEEGVSRRRASDRKS